MASVNIFWCSFCKTYYYNWHNHKATGIKRDQIEKRIEELEAIGVSAEIVRDGIARQCNDPGCRAISKDVRRGREANFKPFAKSIGDNNTWGG